MRSASLWTTAGLRLGPGGARVSAHQQDEFHDQRDHGQCDGDAEGHEGTLAEPHAEPGRRMRGVEQLLRAAVAARAFAAAARCLATTAGPVDAAPTSAEA